MTSRDAKYLKKINSFLSITQIHGVQFSLLDSSQLRRQILKKNLFIRVTDGVKVSEELMEMVPRRYANQASQRRIKLQDLVAYMIERTSNCCIVHPYKKYQVK